MHPDVVTSYEKISGLPDRVRLIYEEFEIDIRPDSDLNKYLSLCDNLLDKVDFLGKKESIEVHRAQRIFLAIVECSESLTDLEEKAAFKGALNQITSNPLDPRTPGGSHAVNMIFELEFLQYMKLRGMKARLGEPDIVTSAPFGEYFVACKTINSFKKFKKNLSYGSVQINRKGNGVIALNFEPHLYIEEPIRVYDIFEARYTLERYLNGLYEKHKTLLNKHLAAGDFDGLAIQISCIAAITSSPTSLDTVTQTVYYSRKNLQTKDSHNRFDGFQQSMQRPISLGFWGQ
ncbi:hypothetical protein PS943_01877 [Pseudomonas fluorescens]|uniref:Uncharacterized protein n=1 Tax=Pseudomonas fluorescens TaxID=294 RepID=A0A5E7W5H9_PSEFL|nr:hypothetical protein [Pseudomonas fluorescens]VVQ30529.1 hypothetical protein PS943_01877 [Pseudomonas fluorescens]